MEKTFLCTYMVTDYLPNVVTLGVCVELSKIINQRSHAWRKIQHTVHKLAKGNFP